jgi:nucleotide-binding universal stress UspA family protein
MERIEREQYRVLVALSNRDAIPSLMETALAIAQTHQGEVVVVTVVEVPEGEPLNPGQSLPPGVEALLEQAVRYAEERGATARPVVKIGHRVSRAVVQTAREEDCNFLVIGQPHRQSFFERIVSSVVERVLEEAPCQVAVVYGVIDPDAVQRVVVPVTKGANATLAARLAPGFGGWFDAGVRALTVVDRALGDTEAEQQAAEARAVAQAAAPDQQLEVLRWADPARGLLRAIARDELVLIGAPSSGPVVPLVGETIPALIAGRQRNPVIVVRAVAEHRASRLEDVFFSRK